jgi:hypothetical protein
MAWADWADSGLGAAVGVEADCAGALAAAPDEPLDEPPQAVSEIARPAISSVVRTCIS